MKSFGEKERICELEFEKNGPFWHLFTDGTKMENIFCTKEAMKLGMMALAITAMLFSKVQIITFELMVNHIHLILSGKRDDCLEFFNLFRRRLMRLFQSEDRYVEWAMFQADILPIDNIKSLRNEIIYVNRNAFVVNPDYTPFNYPWGGGWAYFSPVVHQLDTKTIKDLGVNVSRRLTRCREVEKLGGLKMMGDIPFIPSFCRIDIGESMFHDARSYFNSITRNAEAFSQIAMRLKDAIFLTDEEMYRVAVRYSEEEFQSKQLALLSPENKIQLAREMHFKYNASNTQLKRILKIDMKVLEELFP